MAAVERILIVDDDHSIRELLSMHLEERGYGVVSASTGADGARLAAESQPSAIVLDMRLPDGSGIDLIAALRAQASESPVLMITAHHDASTTILAMKAGAFDYLHKPIDIVAFDQALDQALEVRRQARGQEYLAVGDAALEGLVGQAPVMQRLFKDLGKVAGSRANVLIQGETGTGKELVARVLHAYGQSSAGETPFVAVNCAALVETLLESELFGHEKGAFTGAVQTKQGRFELAGQGTLFLDEIGELSPALQSKLLRVLQEREYERVGGTRSLPVRARVVAATHRDLAAEVQAGRFRADLYQRLKVLTLRVPPLRERRDDIPLLVEHLLGRINQRLHKHLRKVTRAAVGRLQKRDWPGNVRELENVLMRAAVLSQGDVLQDEHLREPGEGDEPLRARTPAGGLPAFEQLQSLEDLERDHVTRVFRITGGHRGRTCAVLGISRPTLERKLKRYGLD